MTREKAIQIIQEMCKRYIFMLDEDEAIDMAIEALQAETDGDTISRQDAIETLHKSGLCYNNWLEVRSEIEALPSAEPPYQYSESYVNQLRGERDFLQDMVDNMAEPKTGWIPVSERLPENSGRYIVTLKDSWAITVKVAVYGVMPHDTHNKKVFWLYDSCYDDLDITEDIVAWMPLPESYRQK